MEFRIQTYDFRFSSPPEFRIQTYDFRFNFPPLAGIQRSIFAAISNLLAE